MGAVCSVQPGGSDRLVDEADGGGGDGLYVDFNVVILDSDCLGASLFLTLHLSRS